MITKSNACMMNDGNRINFRGDNPKNSFFHRSTSSDRILRNRFLSQTFYIVCTSFFVHFYPTSSENDRLNRIESPGGMKSTFTNFATWHW